MVLADIVEVPSVLGAGRVLGLEAESRGRVRGEGVEVDRAEKVACKAGRDEPRLLRPVNPPRRRAAFKSPMQDSKQGESFRLSEKETRSTVGVHGETSGRVGMIFDAHQLRRDSPILPRSMMTHGTPHCLSSEAAPIPAGPAPQISTLVSSNSGSAIVVLYNAVGVGLSIRRGQTLVKRRPGETAWAACERQRGGARQYQGVEVFIVEGEGTGKGIWDPYLIHLNFRGGACAVSGKSATRGRERQSREWWGVDARRRDGCVNGGCARICWDQMRVLRRFLGSSLFSFWDIGQAMSSASSKQYPYSTLNSNRFL